MSYLTRPRVTETQVFGNVTTGSFWVEYPSGLIDLTRSSPKLEAGAGAKEPPQKQDDHLEISVDGDRRIRIDPKHSAIVIVDMQNNWGLTPFERTVLPPALQRSFTKRGRTGFGSDLGPKWGPLLMRGAHNSDLYDTLHDEWLKGKELGTDVLINKNRIGGLWGSGTALEVYLKEEGLKTLFFSGVNTDQCVLGTLIDAAFHGYDIIAIKDTTATASPEGGFSNFIHNVQGGYGFVTDSERVLQGV